jgi:HD-GYP domain-containing protein (c-di-GMP phosphodiesterase class II)
LLRSRSLPIDSELLQSLKERNIRTVYLTPADYEIYENYLNEYIQSVVENPEIPVESKCEVTYNLSTQLMQQVYESSSPAEVVNASEQVVNMIIEVIFRDKKASHNFLVRTSMDFALYTHSVNVCLLGVSLARNALGISKQDALERYGPGFLLHDIGMTTIPLELYEKSDPLTEPEWKELRQHSQRGLKLVREFTKLPRESEAIIAYHHERMDGSGYPKGLTGDKIPVGARICAIADAFDALNTTTPYRERLPSFEALKEMRKTMGTQFDERFFKEFLYLFLPPAEDE